MKYMKKLNTYVYAYTGSYC